MKARCVRVWKTPLDPPSSRVFQTKRFCTIIFPVKKPQLILLLENETFCSKILPVLQNSKLYVGKGIPKLHSLPTFEWIEWSNDWTERKEKQKGFIWKPFLWFWTQVFLRSAITEIPERTVSGSRGLKCLLPSWSSIRASGVHSGKSSVKWHRHTVEGSNAPLRIWFMLTLINAPRSIILQWDCVHSSAERKLILGGHFTSNLPCDVEDLLCSNCKLLTHYYSAWTFTKYAQT